MTRAKKLTPGRTEAQVLSQVLEALAMYGIDAGRQNTGAAVNPKGQMVRFGTPGDADIQGLLPDGRCLHVEVKREGFNPSRDRGDRWQRQLARLRRTNAQGGVGLWVSDAADLARVLPRLLAGWRVEIDASGFCYVTDDPPGTEP